MDFLSPFLLAQSSTVFISFTSPCFYHSCCYSMCWCRHIKLFILLFCFVHVCLFLTEVPFIVGLHSINCFRSYAITLLTRVVLNDVSVQCVMFAGKLYFPVLQPGADHRVLLSRRDFSLISVCCLVVIGPDYHNCGYSVYWRGKSNNTCVWKKMTLNLFDGLWCSGMTL